MNYTKPEYPDHEDKPEDWLYMALTFSQALDVFLKKDEGVVIEPIGDALEIHPEIEAKKIIIFNDGIMIRAISAIDNPSVKHGDKVYIIKN
jgi:hypothetical protein